MLFRRIAKIFVSLCLMATSSVIAQTQTTKTELSFEEILYFDFDKTYLTSEAITELNGGVCPKMQENPSARLLIEGNASDEGVVEDNARNQQLSRERTQIVYDYLLTTCGISPDRLEKTWRGASPQVAGENGRTVRFRILNAERVYVEKTHVIEKTVEIPRATAPVIPLVLTPPPTQPATVTPSFSQPVKKPAGDLKPWPRWARLAVAIPLSVAAAAGSTYGVGTSEVWNEGHPFWSRAATAAGAGLVSFSWTFWIVDGGILSRMHYNDDKIAVFRKGHRHDLSIVHYYVSSTDSWGKGEPR